VQPLSSRSPLSRARLPSAGEVCPAPESRAGLWRRRLLTSSRAERLQARCSGPAYFVRSRGLHAGHFLPTPLASSFCAVDLAGVNSRPDVARITRGKGRGRNLAANVTRRTCPYRLLFVHSDDRRPGSRQSIRGEPSTLGRDSHPTSLEGQATLLAGRPSGEARRAAADGGSGSSASRCPGALRSAGKLDARRLSAASFRLGSGQARLMEFAEAEGESCVQTPYSPGCSSALWWCRLGR
jgi:hypothetical protein